MNCIPFVLLLFGLSSTLAQPTENATQSSTTQTTTQSTTTTPPTTPPRLSKANRHLLQSTFLFIYFLFHLLLL